MRVYPINIKCLDTGYKQVLQEIRASGLDYHPRGYACRELRPGLVHLKYPEAALCTLDSRRLNYRFWTVETLGYLAGWGDNPRHAQLLVASNSKMQAFQNQDTGLFDGAYGPRLRHGLPYCYRILSQDAYTRQAYASVWDTGPPPRYSLDVPCTLGLHFYREHDTVNSGLGLTVMMRSNDLDWGFPYDVAAFCALQVLVAGCLAWPVGTYTHLANSLHYYYDHLPKVDGQSVPGCRVPRPTEDIAWKSGLSRYQHHANHLLEELYQHRVIQGGAWQEFVSDLETSAPEAGPLGRGCDPSYWQQWGELIRFSWKEQQ